MSKYFVVNPNIELQDKKIINQSRKEQEVIRNDGFSQKRKEDISKLSEEDNLQYIEGRVIVKVDIDGKDSWTFENGQKIEYKRRFNNFNRSQTEPVNAIVISGEGIKKGAEILVHFNAIHDSNRIFDYKESNESVQYYSVHNDMCFAWLDDGIWQPLPPYAFAWRVFKPYEGLIANIEPTLVKDVLFVTSGELKSKVVKTVKAADFTITAQGADGREINLIRFRPFGDERNKREEEAIAVMHEITDKVLSGEYLIGLTTRDAKTIQAVDYKNRP
jgi:hypothetical protein